jgi:hypothetical protein
MATASAVDQLSTLSLCQAHPLLLFLLLLHIHPLLRDILRRPLLLKLASLRLVPKDTVVACTVCMHGMHGS